MKFQKTKKGAQRTSNVEWNALNYESGPCCEWVESEHIFYLFNFFVSFSTLAHLHSFLTALATRMSGSKKRGDLCVCYRNRFRLRGWCNKLYTLWICLPYFISYYSTCELKMVFPTSHFHSGKHFYIYLTCFLELNGFELWVIEGLDGHAVTEAIFPLRPSIKRKFSQISMKQQSTIFSCKQKT